MMNRWRRDSNEEEQTTTDGLFSLHKSLKHALFLCLFFFSSLYSSLLFLAFDSKYTDFVFIELDHVMFYFWIEVLRNPLFFCQHFMPQ